MRVRSHLSPRPPRTPMVVWDVWSHVCGAVLAWLGAWRWWMAADCSDSLAAPILCCVPHNGLTHGESTLSLFTLHLLAVLIGFLFDSFVARVLAETALSSHDCAFFMYCSPLFFISVGISNFSLLSFSTRFLIIANSRAGFHHRIWTQPFT